MSTYGGNGNGNGHANGDASAVRSGDAVFSFDSDQVIRSWNEAAEQLTGIRAEDAIGRRCWEALGAVDERGSLICHAGCSGARLAKEGWPVPRKTLLVRTPDRSRRALSVSTIALGSGDEQLFLHLLEPATPSAEPERPNGKVRLTARQRDVLALIAEGFSARQISHRLGLAEPTVRNHIRAILVELRVHSQIAAVARARKLGIV